MAGGVGGVGGKTRKRKGTVLKLRSVCWGLGEILVLVGRVTKECRLRVWHSQSRSLFQPICKNHIRQQERDDYTKTCQDTGVEMRW